MIKLQFKVDPHYLAYYTLVNCSPSRFIENAPREKVIAFQNLAWERDQTAYEFLRFGIDEDMVLNHSSFLDLANRAENLLNEMLTESSFKLLLDETMDALSKVQTEWHADYQKSSSIIEDLTSLDLDKEFEVFISHPSLKNGAGGNRIRWTYRQDFAHYNTVYLWHEVLHSFLPAQHTLDNLVVNTEHAIIELLADEELRVRFNGGTYPPFVGHKDLEPLKGRLLPSWHDYLKQSDRDINHFLEVAKRLG